MLWFKIDVCKAKQIIERPAADQAQVPRKNSVIIGRLCICVGKVINECLCCGRRHSCSHIISVGYAEVNYFSGRCPSYASALFSVAYNATSRTCNRPLCGRCANSAVFERKTVLPFRRGKVRRGNARSGVCRIALNKYSRHKQALSHCGTGSVLPEVSNVEITQTET